MQFFSIRFVGMLLAAGSLTCAARAADPAVALQLAPGVWRVGAENAAIAPANAGAVVNTGIIATGDGVIVIDPGPSRQRALVISGLVKSLTAQPVRWVIDTHGHPENVLGNSGFPDAQVIASAPAADLMKTRCTLCLQRLTEQLGQSPMRDTTVRLPTRTVTDGEIMTLGKRRLRFSVFPLAHTKGDLAVALPDAGVLFAGGLVNDRRVPDMHEADLSGWISALAALEKLSPRIVVPGHGEATDGKVIGRFAAYLLDLRAACDRDIAAGGDAATSGERLALPQYGAWVEYAAQHRFNVAHAYREREDAQLMGEK